MADEFYFYIRKVSKMNNNDLARMPRLQGEIEKAMSTKISIEVRRCGPNFSPGSFDLLTKVITINNWYVRGMAPEYSEDRMIVVLYHELGHRNYHLDRDTSPDKTKSEFSAFKNSLEKCQILAETGDKGPLRTALHFIGMRQSSWQEPVDYQKALNRIVKDDIWQKCQKVAQSE